MGFCFITPPPELGARTAVRRRASSLAMSGVDIFDDIRRHAGAAGGKFMHENVVLAAVEEILTQQSLDRSAVSYMGALMLSLQSGAGAEPAVYAGVLKLLERALAHVPRGLLLAKAGRIAQVVVGVANTQVEQPAVLTPVETSLAQAAASWLSGGSSRRQLVP